MPRLGVTALLVPAVFAATLLPASRLSVLVVAESGVDAYDQAVGGVSAILPPGTFQLVDVDHDFAKAFENTEPRVVIAVGSRALAEVRARHVSSPIVSAMALDGGDPDPKIRRVELDVPLAAQLALMKSLWPGRTRAGILRNPAVSRYTAEALEAMARREGFSLLVVDCDGPTHLLKSLALFKGNVDFVICSPDSRLYNALTIKPLVMASLEQRLPLVGFSPGFVRAGGAAGIFPDYADLGRQSAEAAVRLLRGDDHGTQSEGPRKIGAAVNQRVDRLLGVEFRAGAVGAEVYK